MHLVAGCWGTTLGTWCGEEKDGHARASVFWKKVLRTEMCKSLGTTLGEVLRKQLEVGEERSRN